MDLSLSRVPHHIKCSNEEGETHQGGELSSLPRDHPRPNHSHGVPAPTTEAKKSSFSLLPSANKILQEAGSEVAFPENPPLGQKKLISELQKAQVAQLVSNAASKQHQRKFMKDIRCQAAFHETLSV